MLIGYARTSTAEQVAGLEGQERDLRAAGAERIFAEQVSSVATQRPALIECLAFCRAGDTLVVAKPDRLARSTADLLAIQADLNKRGIALLILSMGGKPLDTRDASAQLMLTVLGAVAEFERTLMLERQKEGIAKARADGRYKGRAPTARRQADEVLKLKADKVPVGEIAKRLGISRMSVHRIVKSAAE